MMAQLASEVHSAARNWTTAILCFVAIAISAGTIVASTISASDSRANVCTQINRVQTELRDIVHRQSLGLKANAYFREHPEELAKAQREIATELTAFGPIAC